MGPNNSCSPELIRHLKAANIPISENSLNSFEQILFKHMPSDENTWTKMPPSEFDLLVLPEKED